MAKVCIECGKEIKEETDSPYCNKCDDMLDKKFEEIEGNIIVFKELMDKEIEILNKFEKEDIVEMYLRIYEDYKEDGEFTEDEARVLNTIQKTFNLSESDIGKDKVVIFDGSKFKKIDKDKCPGCEKDIKEDFNLCPYCGYVLKV